MILYQRFMGPAGFKGSSRWDDAKYRLWELRFLFLCDVAGKTPSQLDLEIWNARSRNGNAYQDQKLQTA